MNGNVLRWATAILMCLALVFVASSPALAGTEFTHEIEVPMAPVTLTAEGSVNPIPLDQTVKGRDPLPDGWLSETEYLDGTIHMVQTIDKVTFKDRKGNQKNLPCAIVQVTIADPSQIRSAMSYDDYDKSGRVDAKALVRSANAIAAVNGDFFKYFHDSGYIVRQGVFYRDALNGQRDLLLIDEAGDFHALYDATSEAMAELVANVTPVNTFNLGPVLIENGEVKTIKDSAVAHAKKSGDQFQWPYRMQRVAIVQLDRLSYAIVECDGKADASKGMDLQTFAEYIHELFPDAMMAYNLDGGGSTNVFVNGKRIHKNPDARQICDIIYFATAAE